MLRLAGRFPQRFREIAEGTRHFPCLFPAHPEDLHDCQRFILNDLNLGKRCGLKVRPARGRKTFSQTTWVNELLLRYWNKACRGVISILNEKYDDEEVVAIGSKLLPSQDNASVWLDLIWKLLLRDIPEPENHPRLRQLGQRPSRKKKRIRHDGTVGKKTQAHNVRASIKAKLGVYLNRMLNDSGTKQIA